MGRRPKTQNPHGEASILLSGRVRARREQQGWSQQRLAEVAGVSYGTVRAIERGATQDPGVFTLLAVAGALGVSLGSLVDEDTKA